MSTCLGNAHCKRKYTNVDETVLEGIQHQVTAATRIYWRLHRQFLQYVQRPSRTPDNIAIKLFPEILTNAGLYNQLFWRRQFLVIISLSIRVVTARIRYVTT